MAVFNTYMQFDYRKFIFMSDYNGFYSDTIFTPSRIEWSDSFDTIILNSTAANFSQGADGWLGTMNSISLDNDGVRNWSITGLSYSLSNNIYDVGYKIDGFTFYDDLAELASILEGSDVIYGSASSDRLAGFLGNDTLYGYAGNDRLEGWSGDDWLNGGAGNDVMDGGKGYDWADYLGATAAVTVSLLTGKSSGAGGIDTLINMEAIRGGSFNDTLTGDANDNSLRGGAGNDVLDGGAGFDWAGYSDATAAVTVNLLTGKSSGADGIDTLRNIEAVRGSAYNDTLTGDANDNFLRGGVGNDVLDGGAGNDWADYADATAAVTVSLVTATSSGADGVDTLRNIESISGSTFNDTLTGDANDNSLRGGVGNDVLNGGAGFDWADYRWARSGVTVNLATGISSGGDGADTLTNMEGIRGSAWIDTLTGDANDNFLRGGGGNDVLDGGVGNDWADYRDATLSVTVNLATGSASGGDGTDTLTNFERIRGSALNDTLTGDTNDNFLRGGTGNDELNGGSGFDWADYFDATAAVTVSLATGTSSGADGADTLTFMEAIRGGAFNDTLTGSSGNNSLNGGLGNDKLTGGSGADSFLFDTPPNATSNLDTIADFSLVDDTLVLENGIFTALTATGALNAGYFRSGAGFKTAADSNDYLIYNTTTGALYYDANGSTAGAAIQIAIFTNMPLLTPSDFWII